jgi:hypothetical protein
MRRRGPRAGITLKACGGHKGFDPDVELFALIQKRSDFGSAHLKFESHSP